MRWLALRSWDWIQVEITTRCTAECSYCPRTVYRSVWRSRDMDPATFRRLVPAFRNTGLVFLQGWGEPLLHPDFFSLVRLAKGAGCRVGTTTNGMLLDDESIPALFDSGLDVIAFSLAGADAYHDRVRRGTILARVLDAMECLAGERLRRGLTRPAIHVAYMLLRSGLESCARLPELLRRVPVDAVVVSTLDFVPAKDLRAESVRLDESGLAAARRLLEELGRQGLPVYHYLGEGPPRRCAENPYRALFVTVDGSVAPCVYLGLPVVEPVEVYDIPAGRFHAPLIFGNIGERTLAEVWRGRDYRTFRRALKRGILPEPCRFCLKVEGPAGR
ncbi:MAG: radical SAM protein [Desulfotomaculales bacterium]